MASKVLAILGAFESGPTAQSLTDIAARSGLPLSTVHRLVRELEEWGALNRDPDGDYRVGMRLWELGQHAGRQVRERARPILQDLFGLTQETAHLAIRSGPDVLFVERIYSSKRVPRAARVGGRLPLHVSAVGKVLLAHEDEWFRETYLLRGLEAMTRSTRVDAAALRAELDRITRQGYSITNQEARVGSCSVAVPVFHREGRVGAGLGLVVAAAQAGSLTRYLPALRAAAKEIERVTAPFPLSTILSTMRGGSTSGAGARSESAFH
ncbi:IclR family transcriptional regulator [Georgenia sp. EYE_87]|uniref:IclR family transcriptional regulator n=1 Tax=Georgenia sp. EYE_87 TaxID=2853448 RepID=UPI0020056C36|nr:IclR family transcriptional regulator [Georgenia sp. EYE_87]